MPESDTASPHPAHWLAILPRFGRSLTPAQQLTLHGIWSDQTYLEQAADRDITDDTISGQYTQIKARLPAIRSHISAIHYCYAFVLDHERAETARPLLQRIAELEAEKAEMEQKLTTATHTLEAAERRIGELEAAQQVRDDEPRHLCYRRPDAEETGCQDES